MVEGPSSQTDASCTDTKSQIGNFRKVKSLRIIIYFTWRVPTNPIPPVYNRYTYSPLPPPPATASASHSAVRPSNVLLALAHIFNSGAGWLYEHSIRAEVQWYVEYNKSNRILAHIYSFHLRIERPTLCRKAEFNRSKTQQWRKANWGICL